MTENWNVIYTTAQLYDAELVKEIMADNNIECVIMNKKDSAYGFGEIEVLVPTTDTFRAKQLILDIRSE
jgi:hypothetical protein